jgi:putative ABC transport system permease protein
LAGFLAGSLTAFLHIRFGIGKILAGILSLSMLYTINLRLMSGSNISLLNQENIISDVMFVVIQRKILIRNVVG